MNRASQKVFQRSNNVEQQQQRGQGQHSLYSLLLLAIWIGFMILGVANFFALFPLVIKIIKKSNSWFRDILLYFFANPFFAIKYLNQSQ